jgi:hypothetical protein
LHALTRILKPNGRLALYVSTSSALDCKIEALGRKALKRSHITLESHPLGSGYWYQERHGDIWVWQMDIEALTRHCEARGLRRMHRLSGMLTEMHLRSPLRKLLVHANNLWFRLSLPPSLAGTNLLLFEKSSMRDGGAQ